MASIGQYVVDDVASTGGTLCGGWWTKDDVATGEHRYTMWSVEYVASTGGYTMWWMTWPAPVQCVGTGILCGA